MNYVHRFFLKKKQFHLDEVKYKRSNIHIIKGYQESTVYLRCVFLHHRTPPNTTELLKTTTELLKATTELLKATTELLKATTERITTITEHLQVTTEHIFFITIREFLISC
jgi:hypothetical protein